MTQVRRYSDLVTRRFCRSREKSRSRATMPRWGCRWAGPVSPSPTAKSYLEAALDRRALPPVGLAAVAIAVLILRLLDAGLDECLDEVQKALPIADLVELVVQIAHAVALACFSLPVQARRSPATACGGPGTTSCDDRRARLLRRCAAAPRARCPFETPPPPPPLPPPPPPPR